LSGACLAKEEKPGDTTWADPGDAPPLTDAFFDLTEIRRGRPSLTDPKQAVKPNIRRMG
jgi:hypothetical protein